MKNTYLKNLLVAVGVWLLGLNATGSTAAQQVKVVQASPASLISKMGKQTTLQPKPLSPGQKLLAAQSVANRQGKKAGSLGSSLMLSPTKLTAGSASLALAYPAFVRSASGTANALFPGGRERGSTCHFYTARGRLVPAEFHDRNGRG